MEQMKVSYHREMKKNYLMIEAGEEGIQAFEVKMLVGNAIEGLLKFRIRRSDEHCQFCYEITSRQPLGRFLETRAISAVQLRTLLLGIAQTLIRMEDYLLSEQQILLEPDFIYIDTESFQPGLCLLPGKKGDFPSEFSEFLQFLLGKADHQDKEAVVLIYGLYRESLKENYGLDNLLRWLMKEKDGAAVGTPSQYAGDSFRNPMGTGAITEFSEETAIFERERFPRTESVREEPGICSEDQKERPKAVQSSGFLNRSKVDILLKILEWLLLLPLAIGGVWLWKGTETVQYLTGEGIWIVIAAATLVLVGWFIILFGAAAQKKKEKQGSARRAADTKSGEFGQRWNSKDVRQQNEKLGQQGNQVRKKRTTEKKETGEQNSWQMLFAEEEESGQETKSLQTQESEVSVQEPECHTVLLWERDKKEDGRQLLCMNRKDLVISLSYYPFLIGKQENLADFVIPENTVSRLHVRIDQKDGGYRLTDLNSTNGTMVNNRRLEANETVELQPGDLVDIAELHFQFR